MRIGVLEVIKNGWVWLRKNGFNLLPYLAGLFCFFLFLPFAAIEFDAHHDGLMLQTALDVASGKVLFRDTFTQYGPLTTYLHVLAIKVGGASLYTLRVFTVFVYAIIAMTLVFIWRRILPLPLLLSAFFAWLVFVPFYSFRWPMQAWSSVPALMFQCLALCSLLRAQKGNSGFWFSGLGGIFSGMVFWCRFPVGVYLVIGVLGYFGANSFSEVQRKGVRRQILLYWAGLFLVLMGLVAQLAMSGTLNQWYEQTILGPLEWANQRGFGFINQLKILILGPISERMDPSAIMRMRRYGGALTLLLLSYLPIYAIKRGVLNQRNLRRLTLLFLVVLSVVSILDWELVRTTALFGTLMLIYVAIFLMKEILTAWKNRGLVLGTAQQQALLLIGFVAVTSWMQVYPVPCARHVFWSITPGIGLFIYLYWQWTKQNLKLFYLSLGILFLPLVLSQVVVGVKNLNFKLVSLDTIPVLRAMRASQEKATQLVDIYRVISEYENKHGPTSVLTYGRDALLGTFGSDLSHYNPYFVSHFSRKSAEPEIYREREEFIRKHRPIIAVQEQEYADIPKLMEKYHYLKSHYTMSFGILLFGE